MDAVIFGVYHITEPVRGLISSPLARQDGVKSWISRPICTPPPFLLLSFRASFLFFSSLFSPITQPLERRKCSEWPLSLSLSPFIFAVRFIFHPTGDSTSIIT